MAFIVFINLLGLFLVVHSAVALWQNIKARDTRYMLGFVIYLMVGLFVLRYALMIDYNLLFH